MPIRQLPDDLVNRIAAGEVVERPASVVKELVENALDAGAGRITVTSAGGGKSLIRIADDGHGMGTTDLNLSVERHATSKLDAGDLADIRTLGFRGEALASIGAVSALTIITRQADTQGARLTVAHGKKSAITPASANPGTTIEVADLFAHVPARLKFLKSDRAETMAITDIMKRLALANPEVHFILEGSDRATSNWPPTSGSGALQARATQIIGPDFAVNSVPLAFERDGLAIAGLAGLPTFTRANSLSQYYFVNGRPVRDKVLLGAVRAAYADTIFRDRFPVIALFVAIDPAEIDVNVHPAKTELRFRDPGLVRSGLIRAIGEALTGAGFKASRTVAEDTLRAFKAPHMATGDWRDARPTDYPAASADMPQMHGFSEPSARVDFPTDDHSSQLADFPLGAARAQMFENYIIAQTGESLILIDQHAAHERLVYEGFKAELASGSVPSQAHLIPAIVEMPEEDCARLEDAAPALEKLGLVLDRFGPRAIAVRETPALLGRTDVTALVRDLADGLAEWDSAAALPDRLEAILGRMACHGSVRSGRQLRIDEMNALLRSMEATPLSGQCIHGRPTYVELSKRDIERLFGRR